MWVAHTQDRIRVSEFDRLTLGVLRLSISDLEQIAPSH